MAHKTFISYKYSESVSLRDEIIKALGDDATYYQGETSDSPDLSDMKTERIRQELKDMLYDTSVTIVVVSPNIIQSKWIDWEIEYSLKEVTREDKTSRTNGIVGVIMKYAGDYSWLVQQIRNEDGCTPRSFQSNKLYDIINDNRFNLKEPEYACEKCKTVDKLSGSYISLIDEEDFLDKPQKYIKNAFDKSERIDSFKIRKIR